MSLYDDKQLMAMIQSGDRVLWEKALEFLYRANNYRIRQRIVDYIYHQGGSLQDGQDACHDAFIKAEQKIRQGGFAGQSSIETYIIAIAKFQWLNRTRKKKEIPGITPELLTLVESHVKEYTSHMENQDWIEIVIKHLPERCREAMQLKMIGFSINEISKLLNHKNIKQSENTMTRCKQLLRSLIKKFGS